MAAVRDRDHASISALKAVAAWADGNHAAVSPLQSMSSFDYRYHVTILALEAMPPIRYADRNAVSSFEFMRHKALQSEAAVWRGGGAFSMGGKAQGEVLSSAVRC
ncbi:hypothetical protein CLM74_06465 [Stenotrophomonas sp. MYb57]|nr:hypothetical protein CLM74_06465 [Stenotrophomonas sp. MYb57]